MVEMKGEGGRGGGLVLWDEEMDLFCLFFFLCVWRDRTVKRREVISGRLLCLCAAYLVVQA